MLEFSSMKLASSVHTNDDEISLQSSRKSFRRLQRSTRKEGSQSFSKERSPTSFSNFYVKNIWKQQLKKSQVCSSQTQKQRKDLQKKVRQPTPCKSKRELTRSHHTQSQQIVNNVQIMQKKVNQNAMQSQLRLKMQQIQILTKKYKKMQDKILCLEKQIQQKQQKYIKICHNYKQAQNKIIHLEDSVIKGQQSIAYTTSAIEKLKKSIHENRFNQVKIQNQGYKLRITQLNQQIEKYQKELYDKNLKIGQLGKQCKQLQAKVQMESKIKCQSMKEVYLQNQIVKLRDLIKKSANAFDIQLLNGLKRSQEEQILLQNQINKLRIQLNYINRKHLEQIKTISKMRTQEVEKYRKKFVQLQSKFSKLGKQQHIYSVKRQKTKKNKEQNEKGHFASTQVLPSNLSFELSSDND